MYYVYKHMQGEKVVYVGLGQRDRQFDRYKYRSTEHAEWIETILEKVGTAYSKAIKNFELESDARYFERLMIKKYQPRFNKYFTKNFQFSNKEIQRRSEYMTGKTGEQHPSFGKTGEKSHRFGVKHSDLAKFKMSQANRGRKLSDEHKAIIANHHHGRKRSDETKAKMSASKRGEKNYLFGIAREKHPLSKENRIKRQKALEEATGVRWYYKIMSPSKYWKGGKA